MSRLFGIVSTACLIASAGCGEYRGPNAVPGPAVVFDSPKGTTPPAQPAIGARQDSVVKAAASTDDAIAASLAVIQDRLLDLRLAYGERKEISGDLKQVADLIRPQIEEARSHCDALERAANDLKEHLPLAQSGYQSTATSYRQRAEGYSDNDLKTITLRLADEFEWLASDTPRRIELTDAFLKNLSDLKRFLAEAERCVRDTATALELFAARGRVPEMRSDLKGFNTRLGQFVQAVVDYEEKLLHKPGETPRPEQHKVEEPELPSGVSSPNVSPGTPATPPSPATGAEAARRDSAMQHLSVIVWDPDNLPGDGRWRTVTIEPIDGLRPSVRSVQIARLQHRVVGVVTYADGSTQRCEESSAPGHLVMFEPKERRAGQAMELTIGTGGAAAAWSGDGLKGTATLEVGEGSL